MLNKITTSSVRLMCSCIFKGCPDSSGSSGGIKLLNVMGSGNKIAPAINQPSLKYLYVHCVTSWLTAFLTIADGSQYMGIK